MVTSKWMNSSAFGMKCPTTGCTKSRAHKGKHGIVKPKRKKK